MQSDRHPRGRLLRGESGGSWSREHLQGSNDIFAVFKKGRALVFSTALAQLQATNQN